MAPGTRRTLIAPVTLMTPKRTKEAQTQKKKKNEKCAKGKRSENV